MDGDGPRQPQRKLCELGNDVFLQRLCDGRVRIPVLLPDGGLHLVHLAVDLNPDRAVDLRDRTDAAVDPPLVGVVAQEHHLRTHLQLEGFVCRVRPAAELAADLSPGGERSARQFRELGRVDSRDRHVGCRQSNRAVGGSGPRARVIQPLCDLGCDPAMPHSVQHVLELVLVLPMDGRELVDQQVGVVPDLRIEEPHRAVLILEVCPLIGIPRHRGELVGVAEQHDLRPAKRFTRSLAGQAQAAVDGIQQVGIDHRHFVDHDGVDRRQQLAKFSALLDLVVGDDANRQAEQRVDGLAPDIERRHARRCTDDYLLRGVPGEMIQER